jgi:hypothetical protein
MQRQASEGRTTPVNSAVTAEISVRGMEIPMSSWNYNKKFWEELEAAV